MPARHAASSAPVVCVAVFLFNATPPTVLSTLSLHDALPISGSPPAPRRRSARRSGWTPVRSSPTPSGLGVDAAVHGRSEEHTSELQSRGHLVCRLLLEKKKKNMRHRHHQTDNNRTQSDSDHQ